MSCCTNQRMVYTDTDVVCSSCGTISNDTMETSPVLQKSKIIPCDESRIGSADICPSSILHSKKHRNILESRQNPYEKKLFDSCSALYLNRNGIRRALYLFAAIRGTKKIPLGNAAFFCIWQTCRENNIQLDDDIITSTVKECFSLKRPIRPKKAIFMAQSTLLDCSKKIHLEKPESSNSLKGIDSEILRRSALRLSGNCTSIQTAIDVIRYMGVDK